MVRRHLVKLMVLLSVGLLLVACAQRIGNTDTSTATEVEGEKDVANYEIVTLLPPDAIPAIYNPKFLPPEEAAEKYAPDELVLGVEINGDARAYSLPFLSGHEIVNDTVGGRPIAVTW